MQSEHHEETLYSIFTRTHPPTHLPNGTMTELSFAKTFLSTLDSRPQKLPPDHVADPKHLTLTHPYTLPKMPKPFDRRRTIHSGLVDDAAQTPSALTVTLKSSRNPSLSVRMPGTDVGTTVLEIKERVAGELGLAGTEKVRVLWNKKPAGGDVRTLKEVVGEETVRAGQEVELGVMVLGYKDVEGAKTETEDAVMRDAEGEGEGEGAVAQGASGEEVLGGEEFWADLKGFLLQRIRDEGKAGEVFERFRGSWEKR